ncbi:mannosyltransferase B [Pseudoalteromonas sp. PS1M3]|uniref:glycosyltransferase n=1 Tax=Pseudoalteromonas sp. PS1M3 TaxID=87791 RepID=UPI00194E4EF5|nr:glycosyltransferase [Pseudoalteromonas sp. PS1M3]BBW90324.1 mannosyltransferase B [Pseudoalteromonas sp. PS1M3]
MIIFYNPYEKGFNTGATRRIDFLMSGLSEHRVKSFFYSKEYIENSKILSLLAKVPIVDRFLYFFQVCFLAFKGHKVITEVIFAPVFLKNVYLTIHDLKAFDSKAKRGRGKKIIYKLFSKLAHTIITVSHYTKNQIAEQCNTAHNKIFVIHNGVRQLNINLLQSLTPQKEYDFVYVSSFAKHKRHIQLIKALPTGSSLLLIGRDFGELDEVRSTITKYNSNVSIKTSVSSDQELYSNIKKANIGVFPSIYEGFGIPILEYSAANLFVVATDIPPFIELKEFIHIQYRADDIDALRGSLEAALDKYQNNVVSNLDKISKYNEVTLASKLLNLIY